MWVVVIVGPFHSDSLSRVMWDHVSCCWLLAQRVVHAELRLIMWPSCYCLVLNTHMQQRMRVCNTAVVTAGYGLSLSASSSAVTLELRVFLHSFICSLKFKFTFHVSGRDAALELFAIWLCKVAQCRSVLSVHWSETIIIILIINCVSVFTHTDEVYRICFVLYISCTVVRWSTHNFIVHVQWQQRAIQVNFILFYAMLCCSMLCCAIIRACRDVQEG